MNGILAYLLPEQPSPVRDLTTVTVLENAVLTAEKPNFAFLQLSSSADAQQHFHLGTQLLHSKVPLALLDITEVHFPLLKKLAQTGQRNRVPVILMGSFRFIPAVAALKEIAVSGVLGNVTHAAISLQPHLIANTMNTWRLADATRWCAQIEPHWDNDPTPQDATIVLQGTNGKATARFSLDGHRADFSLDTASCTHQRVIPQAEPDLSELAVLLAELDDNTRTSPKIKSIPMMMELNPAYLPATKP